MRDALVAKGQALGLLGQRLASHQADLLESGVLRLADGCTVVVGVEDAYRLVFHE